MSLRSPPVVAVLFLSALPATAADPPARTDLHGDPLPAGAVARLGTTYLSAALLRPPRFAADGKTFHAAGAGPVWVQWDAATGKRLRVVPLPGLEWSWPWVSADGSVAVVEQQGGLYQVVEAATGRVKFDLPRWAEFKYLIDPLSSDGRYVAAFDKPFGTRDAQTIHVWDTVTGKSWPVGSQGDVLCQLRFSPDGKRLVAHSGGGVTCWEVATGKQLWQVRTGPLHSTPLLFSPDGKLVVVTRELVRPGGGLEIWDATSGKPAEGVKAPPREVYTSDAAGFSPDCRALLMRVQGAGPDGFRFWDLRDGAWRPAVPGVWGGVIDPEGKTLLHPGGGGRRLQRWDLATGKPLYPDPGDRGHTLWLRDVTYTPDGRRVCTAGGDGTVRIWDAKDFRLLRTVSVPRDGYSGGPRLAVSPDGRTVVLDVNDNRASTFSFTTIDVATGAIGRVIPYRRDQFRRDERYGRALIAPDGAIRLVHSWTEFDRRREESGIELVGWDLATGNALPARSVELKARGWDRAGVFSPDGRVVSDGLVVCDAATGKALFPLAGPEFASPGDPAFSADGRFVAARVAPARGQPGPNPAPAPPLPNVWVWDVVSRRLVAKVVVGAELMQLTPDGRLLVTLDATGVSAWDLLTGKQILHHRADPRVRYNEGNGATAALVVAPDGRTAVTGRSDGTCLVWDLAPAYAAVAPAGPPTAAELAAAWDALADPKSPAPLAAFWRLAEHPRESVPFLREKVRGRFPPVPPPDPEAVRRLIEDLGSDDFATREAAEKKLGEVGEPARPLMAEAARTTDSPERARRLNRVLHRLAVAPVRPLPDSDVPLAWAVAVLERAGGDDARRAIEELAAGPADQPLAREARAALARLRR